MPKSTLTTKGQITIPKEIRERLGLQPGDVLEFVAERETEISSSARRGRGPWVASPGTRGRSR